MSTVSEVIEVLERIAPPELAESWDNTGLLVGHREQQVRRILTCLTLTADVADEAVETGAQMIVSHHPVLFRGAKQITSDSVDGRVLLLLMENRIAIYSPHTAFDSSADGVNEGLAREFGVECPQPLRGTDAESGVGAGRWGPLPTAVRLGDFLETVRKAGRTSRVEYCGDLERVIRSVAVACGSAAEFLQDAVQKNCDVFVTGEARFHSVLEARSAAMSLVLMGHYASERPAVERLAEQLAAQTGITVKPSHAEQDPLQCFGGCHENR